MYRLPRALLRTIALAGFSFSVLAQTGPQLSVGPGLIYTIASRATSGLRPLTSFNTVVFKSPGTVYVSDAHSEGSLSFAYVYAIDLTTGKVTVVAGATPDTTTGNVGSCTPGTPASCPGDGGLAVNAKLHQPTGLALDSAGNLFIADATENVIRRVDVGSSVITTFAGTNTPDPSYVAFLLRRPVFRLLWGSPLTRPTISTLPIPVTTGYG